MSAYQTTSIATNFVKPMQDYGKSQNGSCLILSFNNKSAFTHGFS